MATFKTLLTKLRSPLTLIWILAILIRLYLANLPAQPYDIGTYQAWGQLIILKGGAAFFSSTWCDYLPLPVYLFSSVVSLSQLLSISFSLTFKLFFSFLELGLIAWLLKLIHKSTNFFASLLFLLSPALIANTSWWGQTDSLPTLLLLISLTIFRNYLLSKNRLISSLYLVSVTFALAVSFKPITLLALPVFLILYLKSSSRPKLVSLLIPALISFLIFLSFALPVKSWNLPAAFSFLWDKALEQASTYPYTSINAFNFWNFRSSLTTWPADNRIVLGISAHSLGLILFSFLSLTTLLKWKNHHFHSRYAPRILSTLLIIFYTFTTRMHERHLLFGLLPLALAGLAQAWLIIPYLTLSLLYTFNLWAAYFWVINHQTWPMPVFYGNLSSILLVIISLAIVFIWNFSSFFKKTIRLLRRHFVLFSLLVLAFFLRIFLLGHPPVHIFDEVYHAFTAQELVKNNPMAWEWWNTPPDGFAYEWTHPPVAKYGMVLGLLTFGNTAFGWRFFSAVFGVLSIYAVYLLTLKLFSNRRTAYLATLLVSISGLHLVQSRIAMNDIYMLAFYLFSLVFALSSSWKKSALLYGLALASKWSSLYGLIPLGYIYLRENFSPFPSLRLLFSHLLNVIRLLLIALITYLLSYTPFFLAGHTWVQFIELQRQMWFYHTGLVATHAYQSTPLEWLISLRPVWYWVDYGKNISNIYLQSNPLLLWLGLTASLLLLPKLKKFSTRLIYLSYLIFWVPWLISPRIMFFYHYLPSATFLSIILSVWLNSLSSRLRLFILLLIVLVFLSLSPLYYGYPMASGYWNTLFALFPTWK